MCQSLLSLLFSGWQKTLSVVLLIPIHTLVFFLENGQFNPKTIGVVLDGLMLA